MHDPSARKRRTRRLMRMPVIAPRKRRQMRHVARRRYVEETAIDPSLLARLRLGVRAMLLIVVTFGVWFSWMACKPIGWITKWHMRPLRRRFLRFWGAAALWIVNARLEVRGKTPTPPFFLVVNHLSHVDIMVLCQQTGCVFVAMDDILGWPFLGYMTRTSQQLFVNRNEARETARLLDRIDEILDQGDGFTVFAEARCTRGITVLPFKPALLQAAARRSFPVHYATLNYETPPGTPAAGDNIVWWRWEGLLDHMNRFLRLPGFRATITYGAMPITGSNRKTLAVALHEAAMKSFTPIRQGILPELPAPANVPKVYLD